MTTFGAGARSAWPLTLHKSRGYNPGILPEIDASHPLAIGLAFCFVPIPQLNLNLIDGTKLTGYSESALSINALHSQLGQCINFTGARNTITSPYAPLTSSDGAGTGDFTVCVLADPISGEGQGVLFGQGPTTGTINELEVNANGNKANGASAGIFSWYAYNGSTLAGAQTDTTGIPSSRTFRAYTAWRSGTSCKVYIDGVDKTNSSDAVANKFYLSSNSSNRQTLGCHSINASQTAGCRMIRCDAWNRALSQAEIMAWAADPFAMFRYPDDDIMSLFMVGSAAVPPPARQTAVTIVCG